jgi:hypothetical protein
MSASPAPPPTKAETNPIDSSSHRHRTLLPCPPSPIPQSHLTPPVEYQTHKTQTEFPHSSRPVHLAVSHLSLNRTLFTCCRVTTALAGILENRNLHTTAQMNDWLRVGGLQNNIKHICLNGTILFLNFWRLLHNREDYSPHGIQSY